MLNNYLKESQQKNNANLMAMPLINLYLGNEKVKRAIFMTNGN